MLARTRSVAAPDGRTWTVRRGLLPRPPRWMGWGFRNRRRTGPVADDDPSEWWHALDLVPDGGDSVSAVVVLIAIVAALVLAWFVVFPLLFFLADLLIVLLLAAGGVAFRVLFRRPWRVEASTDGPPPAQAAWAVVGVRDSAEAVRAVAEQLAAGTGIDELAPGPRLVARGRGGPESGR